jgi:CcmD family protein
MNKIKNIGFLIALLLISFSVQAQEIANSDGIMKSNGKIYVVMAVVVVIVAGLFIYLLNLDGRISKLEKKN